MTEEAGVKKIKVLIADDNSDVRDLLESVLQVAGYEVIKAEDGAVALDLITKETPDLVLLDVEMPVMTGWEVLRKLRADPIMENLPVLFITSLSQTQNKIIGLDLGADDYLTKPFDTSELLARVRGTLKRHRIELEANPLTGLPGNTSIEREITERIKSGAKFMVLYADLNNFKAFNDYYGFERGDKMIQEAARILSTARGPGDFIGHVGGDDFIMVTSPERAEEICIKVISNFDAGVAAHYNSADRDKGYIEVEDRQGKMTRFPFVGIAIGGVSNQIRPLSSIGQVSEIGAEMKKFAKRNSGSSYAFDRRID